LARFPAALNGHPGRAKELLAILNHQELAGVGAGLYNSLEAPALEKFPLLALFQEFFRDEGAAGTLMTGSGSTTFALVEGKAAAETLAENFKRKFGTTHWVAVVPAFPLGPA
jgi:4-diphosphocytidyl-2C-methyl-D-erythritol kinase